MTFRPPWRGKINTPHNETTIVTYEYKKQDEITDLISKKLEDVLKPYENKEDIQISIMLNKNEHFVDGPDGTSITCKITIKPRKELVSYTRN